MNAKNKIRNESKSQVQFNIVLLSLFITTVYFKTDLVDPFNSPKMWIVMLFGSWSLAYVILHLKDIKSDFITKCYFIILMMFILGMLVSALATDHKYTAFFGEAQRRNGFITYASLTLIALFCALTIQNNHLKRFTGLIVLTLISLCAYGYFQHIGKDFVSWSNPYNSVILTVGNPNFSAALLSILTSMLFAIILFLKLTNIRRFFLLILMVLSVYIILLTGSWQGIFALLLGIAFNLFLKLIFLNKKAGVIFATLSILLSLCVIFGMMQIGPLSSYVYKSSISVRGFYWRAALEMFESNPFRGVGIDRYGAYFKEFREVGYPLNYGTNITSSNAHNTYLQFFSTGGILVGLSYIFLSVLIFYCALKVLSRVHVKNRNFIIVLFSGWIAYQAQSLISIDNIGLSVWGFSLGAGIVGLTARSGIFESSLENSSYSQSRSNYSNLQPLLAMLLIIPTLVLVSDLNMQEKSTLEAKIRFNSINGYGKQQFFDFATNLNSNVSLENSYKFEIATLLAKADFVPESTTILESILRNDSRNIDTINLLSIIYNSTSNYGKSLEMRTKLAKLDQWNYDNYLEIAKLNQKLNNMSKYKSNLTKVIEIAPNSESGQFAKSELQKIKP